MTQIRSQITKLFCTLIAASLPLVAADTATACTGIRFSANMQLLGDSQNNKQENTFAGRTMEFGPDVAYWKLMYVPKDYTYESCKLTSVDLSVLDTCVREKDPKAKKPEYENVKGYSWPVKYSYVGFTPMKHLKDPRTPGKRFEYTLTEINDGINEQGLYCGGLYHMGFEQYSNRPSGLDGQKNMSNMDFIAWILGQFSTVKEVVQALPDIDVRLFDIALFETTIKPDKVPHLHYHVVDKSGDAIVVEFVDGKPKVFTSVGVVTNDPTYDWQVTNLRNYVGLKAANNDQTTFMGVTYKMLSNGTGGVGLPGDFTSTSRFIRAMFFLNATVTNNKISTPGEAITRAFRVLNQFDIPEGSVVEINPDNPSKITMEATSWTSMADLKNLRYYYHTMLNRTVRMIDLGVLKNMKATRPVLIELPQNEMVIDETEMFKLQKQGNEP